MQTKYYKFSQFTYELLYYLFSDEIRIFPHQKNMELQAMQHYLKYVKRSHLRHWHAYTQQQIKLFVRLQKLKQIAQLFYVENLLKRYLNRFIQNVLLPKRKLNEEVYEFYQQNLQKRALKQLLSVAAQQLDLRYRYEQYVQSRNNCILVTYFKQMLLLYRQQLFISQLEKLRSRANARTLLETFTNLWEKFRLLGGQYVYLLKFQGINILRETFSLIFSAAQVKIAKREEEDRLSLEKQKAMQFFKTQGHKLAIKSLVDTLLAELKRQDAAFVQKRLEDAKNEIQIELRNNRQRYFTEWVRQERETLAYRPFVMPESPKRFTREQMNFYVDNTLNTTYKSTETSFSRARPPPADPVSAAYGQGRQFTIRRQNPIVYEQKISFQDTQRQFSQNHEKNNAEHKIIQLQIEEYKEVEAQIAIKIKQVEGIQRQINSYDLIGSEKYTNQIKIINDEQQLKILKNEIETLINKRNQLRPILRQYKEQFGH